MKRKRNQAVKQDKRGIVSLITVADSKRVVSQRFYELFETIQTHYDKKQLIAVTAAHERNGVSTVVGNLAVESALNKQRTLIIDTHLKFPAMAKTFDLLNYTGFTNFLMDEDIVLPTVIQPSYLLDNLDVMTTGGTYDINLDCLDQLIDDVIQFYDCIIFDLSSQNTDALNKAILEKMDLNLVVVKKESTKVSKLKALIQYLNTLKANVAIVGNEFTAPKKR